MICHSTKSVGFSLLELLIALALASLIATLAIPSYQYTLRKAHRAEGKTQLYQLAAALEQYHLQHANYLNANFAQLKINQTSPHEYYQLSIMSLTTEGFTISAIPIGTQKQDSECGSFILNQLNEKNITGTGTIENCWR